MSARRLWRRFLRRLSARRTLVALRSWGGHVGN
jgi:hypothetical protein